MNDLTFDTLGRTLAGILTLDPEAFLALRQFPANTVMTPWQGQSRTARGLADLIWIGAIALVVAVMLAPWKPWAGGPVGTATESAP